MGARVGLLVDDMFVNQDRIDFIPTEEKNTVKEFCSSVLEKLGSTQTDVNWYVEDFDDITGSDRPFSD